MTKLQLSLTDQEARIFSYQASLLGYDLTRFVKYQLTRLADHFLTDLTTVKMSDKNEKMVLKAQSDYQKGNLKMANSLDEIFS